MPKKFEWDEDYSVGIESINLQHQHFIEISNRLLAMTEKEPVQKEELEEVIGELEKYAFYHLDTEEKYFAEYRFPGAAPHIAAHSRYREDVKKLIEKSGDPETDITALARECAIFSAEWLIKHIQIMDKHYATFFQEKGIK